MNLSYAILWDLNGVIVDSGELHHKSFEVIFAEYGYEYPYSTFVKSFGRNNDSVIELAIGKKPDKAMKEDIIKRKEGWYCEHIHGNLKMLPGALDWVKWFYTNGISQAIASSAPMENVTRSLDEFHLGNFFEAIISGSRIPGKPDPKVFLRAAAALETSPSRCIVIEDSLAGMQGALAGGMKCITVATTHPISAFAQASLALDRLNDLTVEQIQSLTRV
jgi:beta-phosphoglucomutase-like phosphatase (HAD superfamily)